VRSGRETIFGVFQVLFWLGVGLVVFDRISARRPGSPPPWMPVGILVVSSFTISSLIHRLFRLPALRAWPRPQRWASIAIVMLIGMAGAFPVLCNGPMGWLRETSTRPILPLVPRLVAACLWCAIYFILDTLNDLRESEMAAMRAEAAAYAAENRALEAASLAQQHELRQLESQMNPHFLFNALNAVAAIKDDPEAVEQVTQDLADYLRFALREAGTLEPLSRELRGLVKYLSVQKRRFGSNLDCRITADTAAPRVLVPPMMIQPLLENALHYGSKTTDMPLRVTVRAHVHDGWLQVVVANSGKWVPPDPTRSPNTGIHSLRRRLSLLVDEAATVDVQPESDHEGDRVRVVIRLPVTPKGRPAVKSPDPA
jgi:hypothetical protein